MIYLLHVFRVLGAPLSGSQVGSQALRLARVGAVRLVHNAPRLTEYVNRQALRLSGWRGSVRFARAQGWQFGSGFFDFSRNYYVK